MQNVPCLLFILHNKYLTHTQNEAHYDAFYRYRTKYDNFYTDEDKMALQFDLRVLLTTGDSSPTAIIPDLICVSFFCVSSNLLSVHPRGAVEITSLWNSIDSWLSVSQFWGKVLKILSCWTRWFRRISTLTSMLPLSFFWLFPHSFVGSALGDKFCEVAILLFEVERFLFSGPSPTHLS